MNLVISLVFLITRFVVTNVCTRAGFCDFCKKEICWKVFKTTYDIIWQINLKEGMLVWFRCCLDLRHFPQFKKNYPFYPLFILRIILFSSWFSQNCLKLGLGLSFCKDRKRIKTAEWWEVKIIVGLVRQPCWCKKLHPYKLWYMV